MIHAASGKICCSLAVIAGFALAFPALANAVTPGEEGELANYVPPEHGARACYSRTYDAAHLKQHPKQQVTEMQFRIAYYQHEPDDFWPKGQRNYYFEVLARLRGEEKVLTTFGDCMTSDLPGAIFCGVDDDGGGVVVRRAQKPGGISIDLEATQRLRLSIGDGDGESFVLTPGEDDKSFLLTQTGEDSCPAYDDWWPVRLIP